MRPRNRRSRSCTYAVVIDGGMSEVKLQAFAHYLSTLASADCEVLILDSAPSDVFDSRECILRWVGRHVPLHDYRFSDDRVDGLRAAASLASAEKVVMASADARCTAEELRDLCVLLERHDVVEPEEYVGMSPWWRGVEAGGLLLYRGTDQRPPRSTFAFRRSAYRPLRAAIVNAHEPALSFAGSDVLEAHDVFVRREPRPLLERLKGRSAAAFDSVDPIKSLFFIGVLPLLLALAVIGGLDIAGGYAGIVAIGSVLLAVRGRIGASRFFPLAACLFAPLWIVERSVGVYWSLFARLGAGTAAASTATAVGRHERAASGQ